MLINQWNGNTFGQLQSPQALTPQENLSSPVWVKNYGFSWCYDSEGGHHWDGDGDYQRYILYLPCSFTSEAIAVGWMGCWLPCANAKQYLRLLSDSFSWLMLLVGRPVFDCEWRVVFTSFVKCVIENEDYKVCLFLVCPSIAVILWLRLQINIFIGTALH